MMPPLPTCSCIALGISIAALIVPGAARGDEAKAVEGKVRETRVVAGVVYATVSLGSDDEIRRGTRLRVVGGKDGREFLATIEITNVEPEEAVGRVTGPKAAEVRKDDQVRTEEKPAPPRVERVTASAASK